MIEIREIDAAHQADIRLPNEPFPHFRLSWCSKNVMIARSEATWQSQLGDRSSH